MPCHIVRLAGNLVHECCAPRAHGQLVYSVPMGMDVLLCTVLINEGVPDDQ